MCGKSVFIILIILCAGILTAMPNMAESSDTPMPMRELLLLQEIPVVVSPTKTEQSILESPSTITVLTREDIRRYGISSLSDILRNVPGMDVMAVSSEDRNISIRGINQLTSGRILSMVDNMPVYIDFYGETLWEFLPVSVDEIERIEIIRGPGSALYGANAFDGIVSIMTSPSADAISLKIATSVDQTGKSYASITHGGQRDAWAYSLSAQHSVASIWGDEPSDPFEKQVLKGNLQYEMDSNSYLALSGSVYHHQSLLKELQEIDATGIDSLENYLKLNYTRSDMKCQLFWHRKDAGAMLGTDNLYDFMANTLDLDLQDSFRLSSRNTVTLGLNCRFNMVDSLATSGLNSQLLLGGYVQDQTRLSRSLNLTLGMRYDRHPLTGYSFSPRGSIVYSPLAGHAFRASAGRAFHTPPYTYTYLDAPYSTSVSMLPVPITVWVYGNEELSPEWITAFELGYQGVLRRRFRGGITLFFNKLDGQMNPAAVSFYPEDALFPGSPGSQIPSEYSIFNNLDANAKGGELSANLAVTQWLSAYANYSYQYITNLDTEKQIESAPQSKLNSGICMEIGRGLLISLFANYVDKTVWDGVELDSYAIFNSIISFRPFGESLDMALSISNLLNNKHLEHPEGDEIGRSIVLRLMYQI